MRLVVISGLSGSGKSVALHVLEDLGFYCIDNIPAGLLRSVVEEILLRRDSAYENVGVGLAAGGFAIVYDDDHTGHAAVCPIV